MSLSDRLLHYTAATEQKGLLRRLSVSKPESLAFDSNDYLSLTRDKRIAGFYQDGYASFPTGSGGSMLLSGYHSIHQTLEQSFAAWLEVDACLLFSSGYAANLALTGLLGQLKAHCFIDKGVHASIYDGLALAQVPFTRFLLNDLEGLS
ncbi:MAG: 8-amino-7-oxononanoate synthase, partial [Legionellales bacterium]